MKKKGNKTTAKALHKVLSKRAMRKREKNSDATSDVCIGKAAKRGWGKGIAK